jgi:sterol desaturase/sphingolipid hydroxylase (fatty acid hydroxylase superfamily)
MDFVEYRTVYLIIAAIALSAALIEGLVLAFLARRSYNWKSYFASLAIAAGRRVADFVPIAIAFPGAFWLYEHRLIDWDFRDWPAYVALFFILEFAYYWFHRASHRVRLWWLNHSVHHSPNDFTLAAAYRLGWTGRITLSLVFFVPIAWLGFHPVLVAVALGINLLYQFWIHAEWIPKLGFLEGILNTPSAHRVHHASNVEYLDANYGGVLVIFDRMFGTYIPERDDEKPIYGWVQPMRSHNPLVIVFRPWADLWRDLKTARSMRDAIGFLLRQPGWQPDGNGPTTENLRKRANEPSASTLS